MAQEKNTFHFSYAYTELKLRWKLAFQSRWFLIQCIITLLAGIFLVILSPLFFHFIQSIHGNQLDDVLLNALPAYDMSLYIFICLYTLLIIAMFQLSFQPVLLLKGLQAYLLLIMMRGCCICLFSLEPHPKIIPLVDPFIDHFFYEKVIVTKDLFFSGHISTLSLLCIVLPSKWTKITAVFFTLIVACLLLVQHVHYTVDVLAAPIAAWLAWKIVNRNSIVNADGYPR